MYSFTDYLNDFPNARRIYNTGKALYASYVAYKAYKSIPHSSSSNAPMKRKTPPSPPKTPKRKATRSAVNRNRRSRMVVSSVSIPRRRMVANKKVVNRMLTRRKSYRKKYGGKGLRTTISGGYFGKGSAKKNILDYYAKYGFVLAKESGFNITTTAAEAANSVIVGHAAYGKRTMRDIVSLAMTKMIAVKLNKPFNALQQVVSTLGFRITIFYRDVQTGAISTNVVTSASTATWNDVRTNIGDTLAATSKTSVIWSALRYEERTTAATPSDYVLLLELDLLKAKIDLYSKGSLKIQNRTRESAVDSTAVDNVPLFGKFYEGSGNYFLYKNDTTQDYTPFIASTAYNTFNDKVNAGKTFQSLREPPPKTAFYRVSKEGKAHLDPGMIKTSVLTYRKKLSLNAAIRIIGVDNTDTIQHNNINYGKFRFFILEKMLQSSATTDINGINVAVEHDQKLAGICTCPKSVNSHFLLDQTPQ